MHKFKSTDAAEFYGIMNEEEANHIIHGDFHAITGTDINMILAAIEAYPHLWYICGVKPIPERLTDDR